MTHFLTIEQLNRNGKLFRHKFFYDEDKHKILQTIDLIENNSEYEEYAPTTQISVSEFVINAYKYMCHPGVTWSDEEFVSQFLSDYIFETEIFEL